MGPRHTAAVKLVALSALVVVTLAWPGQRAVGAGAGASALDVGHFHGCAQTAEGAVDCWGSNEFGQVGEGCSEESCPAPVAVPGFEGFDGAVEAGGQHTCALSATGGLQCWGWNRYGQLGDGTTSGLSAHPTPVEVTGLQSGVVSVALGGVHTCALTDGGGVKCWGWNRLGQLGDGQACGTLCPAPVDVPGLESGVAVVAAGENHVCVRKDVGGVLCWGGDFGLTPVDVPVQAELTVLSGGGLHTCALTAAGGVQCWGTNSAGQLGDGTTVHSATPVDVSGLESGVAAVTAGRFHTCALTNAGSVRCWGDNGTGQLGDGTTEDSASPVEVCSDAPCAGPLQDVVAVGAGADHSCALLDTGAVKCWGGNLVGQLGDGTFAGHLTPDAVFSFGEPPDSDLDGCADARELGVDEALGGGRNPKNFWDFFDTPDAGNVRDGAVGAADIARVVARFGSTGSTSLSPLSVPAAPPVYHTAFDRTPPGSSSGLDQGPNGSVSAQDITLVVVQFGHTCA